MKKTTKLTLSIPSLLLLILIPFNFFADFSNEEFDIMFNALSVVQVLFLIGLIYTVYDLWKNPNKSKSTKWTWTLMILLVMQPLTSLIYLWAIEPENKTVPNKTYKQ